MPRTSARLQRVMEFSLASTPFTRNFRARSSVCTSPSGSHSRSSSEPCVATCYFPKKSTSSHAHVNLHSKPVQVELPESRDIRRRVKVSRLSVVASAQLQTNDPESTTKTVSDVWELDFCSRPILDERKKKVWELLICDPDRTFEYQEYFPNNKINSTQLKQALLRVMKEEGVKPPKVVRFFRAQMQTIITRACSDLKLKVVPTRRCRALIEWLEERHTEVYPREAGYDADAVPLMTYEVGAAQEIADALRGEQWAFVILPLEAVLEEASLKLDSGFGEQLSVDRLNLPPDTMIPGVAVFSQRALPLAAWTNGLELVSMKVDDDLGCLMLETGITDQWRYASYRRTKAACAEALEWEAVKKSVGGLHFLAIQKDPEAEGCEGFWMMQDTEISPTI